MAVATPADSTKDIFYGGGMFNGIELTRIISS